MDKKEECKERIKSAYNRTYKADILTRISSAIISIIFLIGLGYEIKQISDARKVLKTMNTDNPLYATMEEAIRTYVIAIILVVVIYVAFMILLFAVRSNIYATDDVTQICDENINQDEHEKQKNNTKE
ncbi:MAG: hypothetical protein IJS74_02795 [Clostridia bacterium]|nr:hypothetical protein [Clostridia bacterium]